MNLEYINVVIGAVAGAAAGGLTGWTVNRRRNRHRLHENAAHDPVIDPLLEKRIQSAARRWAEEHDRPEAEKIVADKLRLGISLQQRRRRRFAGWSRWSR